MSLPLAVKVVINNENRTVNFSTDNGDRSNEERIAEAFDELVRQTMIQNNFLAGIWGVLGEK